MKARLAALPPRAVIAIAAGAVLVYALALWFLLIAPKRAEATTLADGVIAAELRLAEVRVKSTRPQSAGTQVLEHAPGDAGGADADCDGRRQPGGGTRGTLDAQFPRSRQECADGIQGKVSRDTR